MSKAPPNWNGKPTFVEALKKLRELSVRIHRIDLADKMNRTKAMLHALTPPSKEARRG